MMFNFLQNKKKLVIIVMALVIVGAAFYYFDFIRHEEETPINPLADPDRIQSITELIVVREDLDEDIINKYTNNFNKLKDFFLQNIGDLTSFQALRKMGQIKRMLGDANGAEEAFLYAYELDPGGYVINGDMASIYHYDLKDYKKAEKFYLDALAVPNIQSGNHYTYFAELHELYRYRLEDDDKAEALIERALEELPDHLNTMSLAAEFYKDMGNITKARELYEKMLAINPDSEIAKRGLESLSEK